MRRTLCFAALTAFAFGTGGCGIPEETHNAVLKDLEKTKAELAASREALKNTENERNGLKDKLASTDAEYAKRVNATKKEMDELRKAREAAETRNKTFRQLYERLSSMISAGKLQVVTRKGRMIVKMSDKILFDPGKTELKADGKGALTQLAAVLKDIEGRDFLVVGHTDNVPIRGQRFKSNWELSTARSVEVVKFLQAQGMDPKHLGAAGFSEFDPVEDNANEDGRRSNRRIEIVLMPNIEEMPQIDAISP